MSVQSQIDRINQNVANTYAVLGALGADMPTAQNSDNLAETAGSAKAVLYSEQSLTETQKEQARKNIGAVSEDDFAEIPKSILHGKTCVCFGDSITSNLEKGNGYPEKLAEITGMTVVNGGFSGLYMSTAINDTYDAFTMVRLSDSVASGDWTAQDNALLQMDEAHQKYSVNLEKLKAVDWTSVDMITIAFGTNDIANYVPIDSEDEPLNTATYLGALRYSLNKIMTAYPNIRIYLLTPIYRYWSSEGVDSDTREQYYGRKFYDWGDGLLSVAREYKVSGIDMYRTLGINAITRSNYLSDGTHLSANGINLMAEKIAGTLISGGTTGATVTVADLIAALPVYTGEVG